MSHEWNGKSILHPDHHTELEKESANNEFMHGMPRHKAEEKAYNDYRKHHHLKSAAAHLRGMKAAAASGDVASAKKHGAMYELHCKNLGKEPWAESDEELKEAMKDTSTPAHSFKSHKGDQFVLEEYKSNKEKAKVQKSLAKIYELAVEVLKKNQE